MKISMLRNVLLLMAAMALSLAAGLPSAQAKPAPKKVADLNQADIGTLTLVMAAPAGMTRVDGKYPAADEYIKSLEPKFKLRVLAIYADPAEWKSFVEAVAAHKPASIPRYAMICVPKKMAKKSFTAKTAEKELKRYASWFSFAANNGVVAKTLTSKGNAKLTEKMGVDIGFKFLTDKFTKKFDDNRNSLSLGARVSFNVFGQRSEVFLTATSLQVADKLVFLAYFENSGPDDKMQSIKANSLNWRDAVAEANAVTIVSKQ
ncbi:hypothetical protein C4J81_02075 [Deltaproteobacteria bacterium Smac51]|nr:hypothetical protein C4J81_02075 [Deltaproteobacteria bacterium Smac51]